MVDATHTFFSPGSEPKTTLFTPLPKDDLKKRVQTTATELRNFASDYRKKIIDHLKVSQRKDFTSQKAELDDLEKQSTLEFQTKILPQARELHFELLRRLNLQWPVCSTSGLSIEGYRAIALGLIGADDAGPTNIAKYLETLVSSLS